MLVTEVEATLKRLASHVATKWQKPYSLTYGYVRSRVTIIIVRDTCRCIRVYQVMEIRIGIQISQWGYSTGLQLY